MLVGLCMGVLVGVLVGLCMGVFVGVLVGLCMGVLVGVSVGVPVGVSVAVFVGVLVVVSVGALVVVLVGVSVGVSVGVKVGVNVAVSFDVLVGVEVGDSQNVETVAGADPPPEVSNSSVPNSPDVWIWVDAPELNWKVLVATGVPFNNKVHDPALVMFEPMLVIVKVPWASGVQFAES